MVPRFLSLFVAFSLLASPFPIGAQETNAAGTEASDIAPADQTPGETVIELHLEVEGRPLTRPEDVLFYGDRVPRSHFYGDRYVSERRFFEITGDDETARLARNHRVVNMGLGAVAILSFFSGLVLFGAADEIELRDVGINPGTTDRGFSLALIGGSLVPAVFLTARRQYWAPLEYTYQTMERYNGDGTADEAAASP